MSAIAFPPETAFRTFTPPRLADVRPDVFVRRHDMPKALLAAEASTYGWDTANCIKVSLVNEVLASSELYPKHLAMTLNADENWSLDTRYGPWQVA
jgi:hypothetical protein